MKDPGDAGYILLGDRFPLFLEALLAVVFKSFSFWELLWPLIIFQCLVFHPSTLKQILGSAWFHLFCLRTCCGWETIRIKSQFKTFSRVCSFCYQESGVLMGIAVALWGGTMILLGPLCLCVTPFPENVGRTCSWPIDVDNGDGMCHSFNYVTLCKSPSCSHTL